MRPYENYQRVNITTSDPVRIIVLLYEGAIKDLNQTIPLMGVNNSMASAKLNHALDIINYLRSVLDFEKGAEIAVNLGRLYDYMRDTLAQANIQLDKEKVQSVIGLLQTLLEGWRGIVANQTQPADGTEPHPPADPPTQPIGLSMVG